MAAAGTRSPFGMHHGGPAILRRYHPVACCRDSTKERKLRNKENTKKDITKATFPYRTTRSEELTTRVSRRHPFRREGSVVLADGDRISTSVLS